MQILPRSIWILEDNDDIRELLQEYSRSRGYQVQALVSIDQAWKQLENAISKAASLPWAIVSDFHLDDGTSEEWLLHIRHLWPLTPILCISGHWHDSARQELMSAGVLTGDKNMNMWSTFRQFIASLSNACGGY